MCCVWSACDASTWSSVKIYVTTYCEVFGVDVGYVQSLDCRGTTSGRHTVLEYASWSRTMLTDGASSISTGSGTGSSNLGSSTNNSNTSPGGGGASPGMNGALIGGIVGGIAAALLLGGFIVWLCMRRRRSQPTPSQQQQYGALPQQPGHSSVSFAGPQMINTLGITTGGYSTGYNSRDRYTQVSTRPEGVSELPQTPALKPALAVSTRPAANSLQKPISAPIAPMPPVSRHAPPYNQTAGHGTYGRGNSAAGQQQDGHAVHTAELENSVPGPREMDGHTHGLA